MDTNCLVTKLKAEVNNSKLEKLGCVKVEFSSNSPTRTIIRNLNGDTVITLSGSVKAYYDNAKTQELSSPFVAPTSEIYLEGTGKVEFSNKYGLSYLILNGLTVGQLVNLYASKITGIEGIDGSIAELPELIKKSPSSLTRLSFLNSKAYGELGMVDDNENLLYLNITSAPFTSIVDVRGSIIKLAGLKALKTLTLNYSNVEGDIDEFARAQVAKGRGTNGEETLTIYAVTTNVTWSGTELPGGNFVITYNSSLPNGYSVQIS